MPTMVNGAAPPVAPARNRSGRCAKDRLAGQRCRTIARIENTVTGGECRVFLAAMLGGVVGGNGESSWCDAKVVEYGLL